MPIETNDIVRAAVKILLHTGDYAMNVWWLRADGTGTVTESDFFDALQDYLGNIYSTFSQVMKAGTTFPEVLADQVAWEALPAPASWKTLQNIGIGPGVGIGAPAETTDPLPNSDAAMIRMLPAIRKHQGRKYFPAFCEQHNTSDGLIAPGLMTFLANGALMMDDDFPIPNSSMTMHLVIPNMSGPATNAPTSFSITNVWRDQRRRQQGVGF